MNRPANDIPLIIGTLFLGTIPHFGRLPAWSVCWCIGFLSLALMGIKRGWKRPGRLIRGLTALAGFTGVLVSFGFPFAREAGVCLLSVAAGLKPMEIRSQRDKMVALFLSYFLVFTTLLFSTSLPSTLHMFVSVLLITGVVIAVNRPRARPESFLGLSLTLMLQALPLAVALFFLFPRIQGSLWGIKAPGTGISGISDTLGFGSITSLAKDRRVAFRAAFTGEVPEPEFLYFRALVFQDLGPSGWTRGDWAPSLFSLPKAPARTRYEIILEPHGKKWLPALDLPVSTPPNARMKGNYTLIANSAVKKTMRYSLVSALDARIATSPPDPGYLSLPEGGNPEARALAKAWRRAHGTPEGIVAAALDFFKTGEFFYTLNPPPMDQNSVDQFIFEKKRGYCGHYAASFAFLMRASGIPTRILGGYLGGELNPFGNYLIVRQSEAHAWVEVWLEKKGWTRIDPTSVVAPLRVAGGLEAALPPADRSAVFLFSGEGRVGRLMKRVTLGWDALNLGWNRWVIGYSFTKQNALLSKLGLEAVSRAGRVKHLLFLTALLLPLALLIPLFTNYRKKGEKDPAAELHDLFCRKLARIDLPRKPCLGPDDFAAKIAVKRPDLAVRTREITELYIRMRYTGKGVRQGELKKLRTLVREFNPGRNISGK